MKEFIKGLLTRCVYAMFEGFFSGLGSSIESVLYHKWTNKLDKMRMKPIGF